MNATHTPTERIARETIEGLQVEIDHLIDVGNDNNAAAWQMAEDKAREIAKVCEIVAAQIIARTMRPQHPALPMREAM